MRDESPSLRASLCPDQKAWGAAHSATTGPPSCCFWSVSLHGRGSKLVTVSFCLQSQTFRLLWRGGVPSWGEGRASTSPKVSLLIVYRLQRETRRLVEAVIFHTSFSLRELSVDPRTLTLPLSLRSFSNVSHLFLRVVL